MNENADRTEPESWPLHTDRWSDQIRCGVCSQTLGSVTSVAGLSATVVAHILKKHS